MQAAKIRACPARRKAYACRHICRRGGASCPFASWRWAQGAPAVSAGDRQRGCALALLPGRVVLQQDSRISETADPGAQFRFAAGGQGQDEATIFAVLDLLVGGPDALPYIVGGIGGYADAESSRFVPGQAKAAMLVIVAAVTDMVPGQLHVLDTMDGQGTGMFDFEPLLTQLAAQHIQGIVHGGHAYGDEAVDSRLRLAHGFVADPADGLAAGGLDEALDGVRKGCVIDAPLDVEGKIVLIDGTILGKHHGFWNYTVGQRKGLGIAYSEPLYVIGVDAQKNEVIVAPEAETLKKTCSADSLNWIATPPFAGETLTAKLRSSQPPKTVSVSEISDNILTLSFDEPQKAVTPGQSVVLYRGDIVVGGGIIRKS